MDVYTLLHLKWITNKDLLYSSGDSAQGHVAAWVGGEFGGEWLLAKSLCCPPETITILSIGYTPIQNKKLKKKKIRMNLFTKQTHRLREGT